ncbi:MAG: Tll0287-like domain-containing protein [Burkholderiales bacterium]
MKNFRLLPILLLDVLMPPAMADDLTIAARATASDLIQRLGAVLKKEMAAGGPDNAIAVCRDIAPELVGELSRKTGGRVSRVSLKTRNPLLGQPDAWEQEVLAEFDRQAAHGAKPETLERSEVVSEPQGRFFRYMKAIPVQPLCLTCHGTTDSIPDPVKARLAADYPHDRATGYALGQIRGAATIKRSMEDAR